MARLQGLSPADARRFRTGRPSLDFAHTGGEGPTARWELLHGPRDLERWLSVVLDAGPLTATDELPATRALRAAIWRSAQAAVAGRRLDATDAATLNAFAARPPLAPVLNAATGSVSLAPGTVAQALSTLARDAIDLLGGPLAERIRVCAADDCALLFVDDSHGRSNASVAMLLLCWLMLAVTSSGASMWHESFSVTISSSSCCRRRGSRRAAWV